MIMKVTINELFQTGTFILCFDDSEFDRPIKVSDLKKCNNAIIDKKDKDTGLYPVMVDNILCYVKQDKYRHSGGTMSVLKVEYTV